MIGTNSEVRLSSKFSGGQMSNAFDSINKRGGPLQTSGSSLVLKPIGTKPLLQRYLDVNQGGIEARGQNYSTITSNLNDPYTNNFGIKDPSMNRGS